MCNYSVPESRERWLLEPVVTSNNSSAIANPAGQANFVGNVSVWTKSLDYHFIFKLTPGF